MHVLSRAGACVCTRTCNPAPQHVLTCCGTVPCSYRGSDLQGASQLVGQALEAYPEHAESLELQRLARQQLASL